MTSRPACSDSPAPVGVFRTRVEWIDTDAAGIYHNSVVTRFVEAAEATLMAERGLNEYFPVAPRVRYEVQFAAPLFFGQDVTTVVELVRLGSSSMTFDFVVWGEEFGDRARRRAAHGSYVTVHIDRSHQDQATSTAWPEAWVRALGGCRDVEK
ncbi:MAG: putative thioesterase family domain protein [uncultured Nocardioidaceae bacterium]|uniref:Putative thioesterase family domain protein n=1 Tax=uncultured Nocardioidaceae bacterium TaxID=253824 RepID=A0A6J4MNV8_9ACTN|nr:MAG: putative thioesterase family domain protein [uncultured Nocardioidaceae bacterium]